MSLKIFCLIACYVTLCYSQSPPPPPSLDYPFNEIQFSTNWPEAPRFPDFCCRLDWVDIGPNDDLPRNYVIAGIVNGTKYAISRDPDSWPAFKSEIKGSPLTALHRYKYVDSIPVLINSGNCVLGWYKTKFERQPIPNIFQNWFFVNVGNSKYGDYVRLDGRPGLAYPDGKIAIVKNDDFDKSPNQPGLEMLAVHCGERYGDPLDDPEIRIDNNQN